MKKLFAMLALMGVLLTACGADTLSNNGEVSADVPRVPDTPIAYTYTKETVDYTEENQQYSFRLDMERTDTDRAHYFFDKKITAEQRTACIEATEQILAELGTLPALPEICVLTEQGYGSLFVIGNRVFLTEQDWQTQEYVTAVLMAVYGDFTHYGLVYGYANMLCQRLHWGEPMTGAFMLPAVVEVCDLGLLCFDTAFVSEDDATAAKNLACGFVASLDEKELQSLLADADTTEGMVAVSRALADYYAEHGLTYEPSTIRYGFGGISYGYVVESDIGTFYLCDKWQDRNYEMNPLVSENFLHEKYPEVREFFTINFRQMQQYRDTINLYPYDEGIKILLTDDPTVQVSYSTSVTNEIVIIGVVSIMHEYIHELTGTVDKENWMVEGIARYLDTRYDYYGVAFTNYDYSVNLEDGSDMYIGVKEYCAKLDRPLDMAIDTLTVYDLMCYSEGITDPDQYRGYFTGASFINYLVQQYGEQTVIQSLYGDGEPLPKTHEELVAEWVAYLNETYKAYSKVES